MKILVLSDSHGKVKNMLAAAGQEAPDMIIHLGDYARDCGALRVNCPDLSVKCVRGNCDGNAPGLDTDEFTVGQKHFFITHGHLFGVKRNTDSLIQHGICAGADIVLYGHTHYQDMTHIGEMLLVNPGSIGYDRDYAVIEIIDGVLTVKMKHLSR